MVPPKVIEEEQYKRAETPPDATVPQKTKSSPTSNISMQILGGFIMAIGCAAVAIAFIALNAATLGVVAGLGVVSIFAGLGLFAVGTYKNCQIKTKEPLITEQKVERLTMLGILTSQL